MNSSSISLVGIIFISILICSQIDVYEARVRYEEFDISTEYAGYRLCIKSGIPSSQSVDSTSCRKFCETKTDFSNGGCDCKTLKCVCADVALNFCDFENLRRLI